MAETKVIGEAWLLWGHVDLVEVATVGVNCEAATDRDPSEREPVERMDGLDWAGYEFRSHSVYVHTEGLGADCICDCWDRTVAQQLAAALAEKLGVPVKDYTLDMKLSETSKPTPTPAAEPILETCPSCGVTAPANQPCPSGCGTEAAANELACIIEVAGVSTREAAQRKLDAFREAVQPSREYGITIWQAPVPPAAVAQAPAAAGSKWYVVICRLEYADEDSCYVLQASSKEEAVQKAEAEERSNEEELEAGEEPKLFYLNYVVEYSGESKPVIVADNAFT